MSDSLERKLEIETVLTRAIVWDKRKGPELDYPLSQLEPMLGMPMAWKKEVA